MTQEFIDRLFAAVMGKCIHSGTDPHHYSGMFVCAKCGKPYNKQLDIWSPSLNGEATKEVRDWFAKEMPEEWKDYVYSNMTGPVVQVISGHLKPEEIKPDYFRLNRTLSITNLAQYIVENYKEMFMEECKDCYGSGGVSPDEGMSIFPCPVCNGTGLIVKPQFAEAVKVIEEGKE